MINRGVLFIALIVISITNLQASEGSSFVWGADIGSTIDMSNNDMSTMNLDVNFGYKNSVIRTLGVGAGVYSALGNSNSLLPVYLILRNNFSANNSGCFLDLRGGYSFNTLKGLYNQSGFFGSAGIGVTLFATEKAKSHLILSYNFYEIKPFTEENGSESRFTNVSAASVRLGVSF